VILHADAVAENGSAGVGTGRIDRDDSNRAILLAIEFCELIDERALTRTRRARKADHSSLSRMQECRFHQIGPPGCAILDD